MSNSRTRFVDLFRGIGIVCMIMAHIGFGKVFDHFVHAFHMPMFFFVSGFFFRDLEASEFFTKKAKTLLCPYVFYTLLVYLCCHIVGKTEESLFYTLVFMNSSKFVAAAMWFLPALFFANVFYWSIHKLCKNTWLIHGAVVVVALLGNCFHIVCAAPCPFALDAAAVGVGMMHLGFLLRHSDKTVAKKLLNLSLAELAGCGAVLVALIFLNSPVNMRTGRYGIIPLFWLNAGGELHPAVEPL